MPETSKEAIYQVLQSVPRGKVATYGQIAKLAGLGRAARLVGTSLKRLPPGSKLPWHRVINSQGSISLPEHNPSRAIQITRLIDEGIEIKGGKVNLRQYLWEPK